MSRYQNDPAYRQKIKERTKTYQKTNPIIKIRQTLRRRVRKLMTAKVKGVSKLVGCSTSTLRSWIESKFDNKMTWNNYGSYWVIDHKIPLAAFDLDKELQRQIACHYTNLQPLTRQKNHHKAASIPDPQLPLRM